MKKFAFITLLITVTNFALAQLSVISSLSNRQNTFVTYGNLQELKIINSSISTLTGTIQLSVNFNGEIASEYISNQLSFGTGITELNSMNFRSEGLVGFDNSKFVKPGKLNVKVVVKYKDGETVKEKVENFTSQIYFGQIQLNGFVDEQSTYINNSQFCWQTISSSPVIGPYKFQLWKDDRENIQSNISIMESSPYFEAKVSGDCFEYPANAPVLDNKSTYYWLISFSDESNEIIGRSQLGKFQLKSEKPRPKGDDYRLITNKSNSGNYIFGTYLRFAFDNRFSEKNLSYKIQDLTSDKSIKRLPEIELTESINYIDIDLLGIPGLIFGHTYRMFITDQNKVNYSIQFEFKKN